MSQNRLVPDPDNAGDFIHMYTGIDPVYKIFQRSENDAEQSKPLLDVFDTITEDMNATVIYSLHDKKGHAGGMDATDRGAGSGIAGRDYDAALTITNHADHATDPDLRVAPWDFRKGK